MRGKREKKGEEKERQRRRNIERCKIHMDFCYFLVDRTFTGTIFVFEHTHVNFFNSLHTRHLPPEW